jgi:hypothetical protein
MEVEENYVLPVAQQYLFEADWHDLFAAFARQSLAVTEETVAGHRALLQRVLGDCSSPAHGSSFSRS